MFMILGKLCYIDKTSAKFGNRENLKNVKITSL